MNIGIDIDGVLTNLEREVIDGATKMSIEEKWPINIDVTKYHEIDKFNWDEEQATRYRNKYLIKYFMEASSRGFASEIIEKLKQDGNKIYIITARNEFEEVQNTTKKWLKDKNIQYDEIIFATEKLQPCIENKIDVMIEDCPENIQNLSKQIKVIKFDCQYNKKVINENVITAYSWYHIYKIINEMRGE